MHLTLRKLPQSIALNRYSLAVPLSPRAAQGWILRTAASPNYYDWALAFRREPNVLAHAYWRACCGGKPMPRRADLDPVAMRKFTSHVGLVEIHSAERGGVDYLIRRAGSKWEEVYGPMTGKLLHEFLPEEIEPSWREAFDTVRLAAAPVRLNAQVDFQSKSWLEIEMLIAPLGEGNTVSMLLTCFVAWEKNAL